MSTGSMAILGDAIHSLTDFFNNIVAWAVIRFSIQPPDREHPYGHRKFETLAVFGLASLLTLLSFELVLHAIQREQTDVTQNTVDIVLMLMVLTTNIGIAAWQRYWANKLNSAILLADASHTFADVLTSTVVIIGWLLAAHGYVWLDTICAIGVAILVLFLAVDLFKRSVPILVDHSAINPDKLQHSIIAVPGVKNIKRLRSRYIGSHLAVDMIITVEPHLSTADSHDIADRVEDMLENQHDVNDITIHIEPETKQFPNQNI